MEDSASRRDPGTPPWGELPGWFSGRHPYGLPLENDKKIAEEWEKLQPIWNYFDKPFKSLKGYTELRYALLGAFGAAEDGDDVALERTLKYFRDECPWVTFMGFPTPVHKDMKASLEVAEQELTQSYALDSFYGLNIRWNKANKSVLSEHSWGAAVDINASTSPMTEGIEPGSRRAEMIKAITGTDPSLDSKGEDMSTKKRTGEEMLEEAERLNLASDRFVAAFADQESLVATAFEIAEERGAPAGGQDRFEALLFMAARKTSKKWKYQPSPPPKDARQALGQFVFPEDEGDRTRLWDQDLVVSTVDLLAHMAWMFEESFVGGKDPDERVPPNAVRPSDPQLAVHGFLNIPPELIAALSGSDKAGLIWRATSEGPTKDFHHFELRKRPDLY